MDLSETIEARTARIARAIEQELPPGSLFRAPLGPNISAIFQSLAFTLAQLEEAGARLVVDANPASTAELLSEWELAAGLPDDCLGEYATAPQRRAAIVAKLQGSAGPSAAALIAVAAMGEFLITIEVPGYLRAGFRAGDRVGTVAEGWPWTMIIHAPRIHASVARCGIAQCGDPIASFGVDQLRCLVDRAKQAQMRVVYVEDGPQTPLDWQPWGIHVHPETLTLRLNVYKPTVG